MIDPVVDRTLTEANVDEKSRMAMQDTAQTILRILGNTSVLINQVVPANFGKFWNTMIPLMKPKYKDNMTGEATQDIWTPNRQKEPDLTQTHENPDLIFQLIKFYFNLDLLNFY